MRGITRSTQTQQEFERQIAIDMQPLTAAIRERQERREKLEREREEIPDRQLGIEDEWKPNSTSTPKSQRYYVEGTMRYKSDTNPHNQTTNSETTFSNPKPNSPNNTNNTISEIIISNPKQTSLISTDNTTQETSNTSKATLSTLQTTNTSTADIPLLMDDEIIYKEAPITIHTSTGFTEKFQQIASVIQNKGHEFRSIKMERE